MSYERELVELLDLEDGQAVLDLGCGTGKFLSLIQDKIELGTLVGIDSDSHSIGVAQSNLGKSAELKIQDFDGTPLPFADESFDRVICHNVIECIVEKARLLDECYRCLKTSGKLVLSHHDFDTATFNSNHKELTRTLVHLFSDTTQAWQKISDGQIGRKLKGMSWWKNTITRR